MCGSSQALAFALRLAAVAEYRDADTRRHTERVGRAAAQIGEALGLDAPSVALLRCAAPLHDVGKIAISARILLKPGPLDAREVEQMRTHPAVGARILRNAGDDPALRTAALIARTHHERWDGAGYPDGLVGEDIPLVGRIVIVADVFDALTHARPYKPALPVDEALATMEADRGAFDPAVADAFATLEHEALVDLPAMPP